VFDDIKKERKELARNWKGEDLRIRKILSLLFVD
jgi:hypothetical protein